MPTDPLESIIYRDLARVQAKPAIDVAEPILRELVNFGSNALMRCATPTTGRENEDLAVLALYRHIMEMTDGVQVLVSESCATPAIPLVRSAFEALVSMEYIVEEDEKYVRRSLSWLVGYVHQRIATYQSLDPTTERGKEFQASIRTDKTVHSLPLPSKADITEGVQRLHNLLGRSQFVEINREYLAMKTPRRWYRLRGGPATLRDLARRVGRLAQYDFLYRHWSDIAHARDFSSFILPTQDRQGVIRPIRDPAQVGDVAGFAATFMLDATRTMIRKFRPGEEIRQWYEREIRPGYLRLFTR